MLKSKIEKGIVVSGPRKIIKYGCSKAVTLDPEWLKIQKWLGQEVTELVSIANSVVVLVPPEMKDRGLLILREIEERMEMDQ